MTDSDSVFAPVEKWSPLLFVTAGAILIVYSSMYGMEAFLESYPQVRDFIGPIGYSLGFAGLFGLYPKLAEHTPKLAGAGAIFAGIGIAGWLLSMAGDAGLTAGGPAILSTIEVLLVLLGMMLAFLTFAIASLQTEVHSRTLGILLLGPFLVNGANFGFVFAGLATPEARFITSGLWAVAHLAIGFAFISQTGLTGSVRPQPVEA